MRIHHLALRTRDVTRLVRFYEEALGLAVSKRTGERSVWLDAGGTIVMIEAAEESEPAIPAGTMELAAAFAIEPGDRQRMEEQLAKAGASIEARTAFTLYVRDPDGRRVGLSAYPTPLT